jgi:enamine deaminase RidA (YjgF/YER057c/UK114 family)
MRLLCMARLSFASLAFASLAFLRFVPHGALLVALAVASGPAAWGAEPRLSISGYDPVAYFTDGKPVLGKPEFEQVWHNLRWRFATAEHRDMFVKDPNRYTPEYDGYCAMGVSDGQATAHKDTVDPAAWTIVDGKLYLAHTRYWLDVWRENAKANISLGDANWQALQGAPDPVVVGPPCAASPPTTVISLRDGGRLLAVGAQVPRDEGGNLVGKGDMRAQIEQVGKNVDACLKAGGAAAANIVWTVNHVVAPGDFAKYADLRGQYFGPPSAKVTIVPEPPNADPDILLRVEVFAAIR